MCCSLEEKITSEATPQRHHTASNKSDCQSLKTAHQLGSKIYLAKTKIQQTTDANRNVRLVSLNHLCLCQNVLVMHLEILSLLQLEQSRLRVKEYCLTNRTFLQI